MLELNQLLTKLKYNDSPHYYTKPTDFEPETAHLFRAAKEIGITGTYVIETSSDEGKILPAQPVIYVADIQLEDKHQAESKAKEIHQSLWNLCFAPFIILKLPHQIRIYTGFNYSVQDTEVGLLEVIDDKKQLPQLIKHFSANAIDTGQIWKSKYAKQLQPNHRVDEHLLTNLRKLGKSLKDAGLHEESAHALIGKYVFLSYLRERNILSDIWLSQQGISPESIFSRQATRASLKKLIEALSDFNGKVFPIDFDDATLQDKHISWVAAVFKGDQPLKGDADIIWQLHLNFQAYNFRYIPVETLSAIYEQFLVDGDKKVRQNQGIVYTPEFLADYVLSEVASIKPLQRGMRILDPACGSGIFLVLAYRRLIESLGGKTTPEQLRDILTESIFGVERKRDACYVTEFSLILTLLHYSEPGQLEDLKFKLPDLHNTHIFECDFFDFAGESCEVNFWDQDLKFDWVVGNPPWIELKPKTKSEKHVRAWFQDKENKTSRPTGGNRVAEAFSWAVTDLLKPEGVIGLLLPATSLVNLESQKYRQEFFTQHEIYRITNFANFRETLFGKKNSGVLPAATIIYHPAIESRDKSDIIHYSPFVATQQATEANHEPWLITINESEIQTISSLDAEKGETSLWKLALWGTPYDKRVLDRLRYLFPTTLMEFCKTQGWGENLPCQGVELKLDPENTTEKLEFLPELVDTKTFDTTKHNKYKPRYRFSVPYRLEENPKHYLRLRGGKSALSINFAPHIILSKAWQNFAIYSDENFVIPPQQLGISVPNQLKDKDSLRALAIYLSSSTVAYFLFFHVPEWGVFRQRKSVVITKVREIPTPLFTSEQTESLANLHRQIVKIERKRISAFVSHTRQRVQKRLDLDDGFDEETALGGLPKKLNVAERREYNQFVNDLHEELQTKIDDAVFDVLDIPKDIQLLVKDFVHYRLPLDKSAKINALVKPPNGVELLAYAHSLQRALDDFAMEMAYHRVSITYSDELIECVVEITDKLAQVDEDCIQAGNVTMAGLLSELSDSLQEQVSQWIYIKRGLRLFDGPRVYIYKSPRLIDWTHAQALNDASDIIGSSLLEKWGHREAEPT